MALGKLVLHLASVLVVSHVTCAFTGWESQAEEVTADVEQETAMHRFKRDVHSDIEFPTNLSFTFRLKGNDVRLNLVKNKFFKTDVTMHGGNGSVKHDSQQRIGMYHDRDQKAAILVLCEPNTRACLIQGSLELGGQLWTVSPRTDAGNEKRHLFRRATLVQNHGIKNDALKAPQFLANEVHSRRTRQSRDPTFEDCYVVEVGAFPDHHVYQHFVDMYGAGNADLELRNFIYSLYNEVDLRYSLISQTNPNLCIRVVVVFIQIATTGGDANWSGVGDIQLNGQTHMNGVTSLIEFGGWANGRRNSGDVPYFDHAQGLTRRDMVYSYDGGNTYDPKSTGLAFKGTMCVSGWEAYQASVIEAFGPRASWNGAHQIGHALGPHHDSNEGCNNDDGFIMSDEIRMPTDPANVKNPWMFSTCSINKFSQQLSSNPDCLRQEDPNTAGRLTDQDTYELPGARYSLDDQCRLVLGATSGACGPRYPANICSIGISCYVPGTPVCSATAKVFDGTPCNDAGDICLRGVCTAVAAPAPVPPLPLVI